MQPPLFMDIQEQQYTSKDSLPFLAISCRDSHCSAAVGLQSVLFSRPSQGTPSNCILKFLVFPVRRQIFPVSIYVICDYYIYKTNLADLSSFEILREIFAANIEISFTWGHLQLEQTKFPKFWQNFQIPVFSLTENFGGNFPVFPVQWVPCK